jgi:flagellar basal-body rod protein FlgG
MSQGVLRNTGNVLDIAIEGDAFFEVMSPHGRLYTRQGNLHVDAEGRLIDVAGRGVVGVDGDIFVNGGQPQIKDDGQVFVGSEYRGQLKLSRFDAVEALEKIGAGMYQSSAMPNAVNGAPDVRVRQGYVEASNVDPTREMVNLITVSRHFESVQKALSTYDQMMDSAIKTIGEV